MIDDKDIEKLIKVQKDAFKEDFAKIDARFDRLTENFTTKTEIEHLIDIVATKKDFEKLETKSDKIMTMLSKMDEKLNDVKDIKHRVEYMENTLNIQPARVKS